MFSKYPASSINSYFYKMTLVFIIFGLVVDFWHLWNVVCHKKTSAILCRVILFIQSSVEVVNFKVFTRKSKQNEISCHAVTTSVKLTILTK